MTISDLGSLGELLAAVATIATLIYLALQIRNNTSIAKAEAARELSNSWNGLLNSSWHDKAISTVMHNGSSGNSEIMDDEELLMFGARLDQYVFQHNAAIELHRQGLVSEEFKGTIDNAMVMFLTCPGGASWWKATGYMYPNRREIDALLAGASGGDNWSQWQEAFIKEMRTIQVPELRK